MFQKKKLRKTYDHKLIDVLEKMKQDWQEHQQLIDLSYEINDEVHYRALLSKAKYLFLLKEARIRKVSLK